MLSSILMLRTGIKHLVIVTQAKTRNVNCIIVHIAEHTAIIDIHLLNCPCIRHINNIQCNSGNSNIHHYNSICEPGFSETSYSHDQLFLHWDSSKFTSNRQRCVLENHLLNDIMGAWFQHVGI